MERDVQYNRYNEEAASSVRVRYAGITTSYMEGSGFQSVSSLLLMASATRFISLPHSGSEAPCWPRSNITHIILQHDTDFKVFANSVKQNASRRGSREFWVRCARRLYRILPEAAFFHGLRGCHGVVHIDFFGWSLPFLSGLCDSIHFTAI